MKLRNKRRAFTIVELVIVVAVIGVLAAVLIPTFVNLTQKANKESDNSLVYHLNTALKMTENDPNAKDKEGNPISGKNYTMHDAVLDLEYQGYYLENLSTRSGYKLLWDMNNNKFLLEDDAALKKANVKKEDYWKVVNSVSEMGDYSGYANTGFQDVTVKVSAGFDTGSVSTITKVAYDRHDATSSKTVTIRTNDLTTELEINAPLDHVNRYGKSSVVEPLITADSSFEDHGYSPWISLTDGRLVVTSDMKIGKLFLDVDKSNSEQKLAITYEKGATKLTQDQIKKPVLNLGENEKVKVVEVTYEETGNKEEIWLQGSSTIEGNDVLVSVNGGDLTPVTTSTASETAKAVANACDEQTGETIETGLTEEEKQDAVVEATDEAQIEEMKEETGLTEEDLSAYEARIGYKGYATFTDAYNAAKEGETISLLKDVDLRSSFSSTNNRYWILKNITVDGCGKSINVAYNGFGICTERAVFKNVIINNASTAARCIDIRNGQSGIGKFVEELTLDHVVLSTKEATSGYTQPLTIGGNSSSFKDENNKVRKTVINVRNNSVIKTNDNATKYYSIMVYNPIELNISKTEILGWANIYLKPADKSYGSRGSVINIDNSVLRTNNIYNGKSNAFAMFMIEDGTSTEKTVINVSNSDVHIDANSDQKQAVISANASSKYADLHFLDGNNLYFSDSENAKLATNNNNLNVSFNNGNIIHSLHISSTGVSGYLVNQELHEDSEGIYTIIAQ